MTSITGYDPDGTGPLAAPITSFGYDAAGNQTSFTNPLGQISLSAFDAQNRVIAQTLPDPDGSGSLEAPVTSYAYTLAGQLASITDPVGNLTWHEYDNAGRLIAVGDPIFYQYDAANQVIGITDRNLRQRDFTYNDLGLMTSETWLDEYDDPIRVMSWTYDDAGQLIAASDPDSSYAYTYDLTGQVTSVSNAGTPDVPNVVLSFTYDYAGNRISLTDNFGDSIWYHYADHRLASMGWTVGSASAAQIDFGYDTVGRLTGITRVYGMEEPIVTGYTYDDGDRLTSITHSSAPSVGPPVVLSQFSYGFDAANRITSYTGPEGTLAYTYDTTGQLIGVSGARTESYSFDENGNRTMTGYDTGTENRLLSDGVYNYTYDLENNLLTKTRISDGEVTTNTYDHRNRLTRVVVTDDEDNVIAEARYTYDVNDRRIGVWEDADGDGSGTATERWTVYDGHNPYADFDANGDLTNQYLYGFGMDQILARADDEGNVDWYLTDYLGSVRQLVETDGDIIDEIDYDSFGQILSETNASAGDRFKYTAREWDALTAQYYYRARYFGPDTGRFTQEDPMRFAAGDSNLYRYTGNAPVGRIDPSGLDWYNPATWEWQAYSDSILGFGESVSTGWAATYLYVIGDPNADAMANHAYRVGPWGQTEDTPWAYHTVTVAVGVSGVAAVAAGGCMIGGFNPILWGGGAAAAGGGQPVPGMPGWTLRPDGSYVRPDGTIQPAPVRARIILDPIDPIEVPALPPPGWRPPIDGPGGGVGPL